MDCEEDAFMEISKSKKRVPLVELFSYFVGFSEIVRIFGNS